LLADPTKCEGLVIRDISHRVKAYVDCNVLLLRISNSREEYCALAKEFNEKAILEKNYRDPTIPEVWKKYYKENLRILLKYIIKYQKIGQIRRAPTECLRISLQ